jgi:hypothetical protein
MRLKLSKLPLRFTTLTTALLVVAPALVLGLFPRSNASGLDRLVGAAAMVQSFAARADQPVPPLWRQRLGEASAQRLWRQQRRLWWQFWGVHGDAGAYLVLSAPAHLPLPANGLQVDDLLVVAPDPLARQLLQDQLKVTRRAPRGLQQRCSAQLRQREAVLWNGTALGQMLGSLAPVVQSLQHGCLLLRSERQALLWQGEADASEGLMSRAPTPLPDAALQPLRAPLLLELQGRRLELLTRGLLSSLLVRQSLAQTYGLGPQQLTLVERTPFQLRLRAVPSGRFQGGLELQVPVGSDRASWLSLLAGLRKALLDQGLMEQELGASGQALQAPGPATTVPTSTWSREDGTVVGGWRWFPASGTPQLLLFLGPVPTQASGAADLSQADWRLRLRPQAMVKASLLPESLPLVVRRSAELQLLGRTASGRAGERQSALTGRLDLKP